MNTLAHKISIILQYIVTGFFGILTLGAFTSSASAGVTMLLATLLACPFTRSKGYSFIENKFKISTDKIKGWIIIPIFVLFVSAVTSTPTVEDTAENQAAEMANVASSLETENFDNETVVEMEEVVDIIETTVPTEAIIEETTEEIEVLPIVSDMEVHFIDVGQGDATLVKVDEHYMLIDAGDNSKGTAVQLYLQKQGVEKLDYLILTHTDADHIGGADVIVNKFDVDTVFLGDFKKDNNTYADLLNAFEYKGLTYSIPSVGSEYQLGNATFTIVAPNSTYDNPNDSSIALVLKNGDNSFLFTGDCEEQAENDILANGLSVDCDVYKIGHHGSKTSSSQAFLNAISPIYGVISCEEGNSYGHPHAEPLNNLRAMGVQMFRTDEQGSIIAYSDGAEITWNCSPSETWQAGESTESSTESVPVVESTPEPEPEPMSEPSNNGVLVWKSATGKKYHSINNCGNMNPNKATQITETEAISQGLGKCSKCW